MRQELIKYFEEDCTKGSFTVTFGYFSLLLRIPLKAAAQSVGKLPLSPWQSCHPIHVKPATQSMAKLPPSPQESCRLIHGKVATHGGCRLPPSERSDAGLDRFYSEVASVVNFALRFRIDSPLSSILYALWTRRSRMASAKVGSPMASCQCSTGNWLVTIVARVS